MTVPTSIAQLRLQFIVFTLPIGSELVRMANVDDVILHVGVNKITNSWNGGLLAELIVGFIDGDDIEELDEDDDLD